MKKQPLQYQIYNENTPEITADFLLQLLIEANTGKVERAIQLALEKERQEKAPDTPTKCP